MINTLLEHVPIKMEVNDVEEVETSKSVAKEKATIDKVKDDEDIMETDSDELDDELDEEEDDDDEEDTDLESEALEIEQEATLIISSDEEAELEAQRIRFPDIKKSRKDSHKSSRSSSRNSCSSNASSTANLSSKPLAKTKLNITDIKDSIEMQEKKQRISPRNNTIESSSNKENKKMEDENNTSTTKTTTTQLKSKTENNTNTENVNKTKNGAAENVNKSLSTVASTNQKNRRESNNSTCSVASTVASDTAETESCGNIYVFNLQQRLIFNCEFCDLKYGDLENFGRHLHEVHKLFNFDEDPEKENAPRNMRKSNKNATNSCPNVKKEPLQSLDSVIAESPPPLAPPVALPLSVLAEPLDSCGNVFMLNHRKLFLICGYCECKYANLELFEKHLRQQHRIFEGCRNEVNVVPKIEIKEEVYVITEVTDKPDIMAPQAMVAIPAEIPLDISINPENEHETLKALEEIDNADKDCSLPTQAKDCSPRTQAEGCNPPTQLEEDNVAPTVEKVAEESENKSVNENANLEISATLPLSDETTKRKRRSSAAKPVVTSPIKRPKRNTRNATKTNEDTPISNEEIAASVTTNPILETIKEIPIVIVVPATDINQNPEKPPEISKSDETIEVRKTRSSELKKSIQADATDNKKSVPAHATDNKKLVKADATDNKKSVPADVTGNNKSVQAKVTDNNPSVPARVKDNKKRVPAHATDDKKPVPAHVTDNNKLVQADVTDNKTSVPAHATDNKKPVKPKTKEAKIMKQTTESKEIEKPKELKLLEKRKIVDEDAIETNKVNAKEPIDTKKIKEIKSSTTNKKMTENVKGEMRKDAAKIESKDSKKASKESLQEPKKSATVKKSTTTTTITTKRKSIASNKKLETVLEHNEVAPPHAKVEEVATNLPVETEKENTKASCEQSGETKKRRRIVKTKVEKESTPPLLSTLTCPTPAKAPSPQVERLLVRQLPEEALHYEENLMHDLNTDPVLDIIEQIQNEFLQNEQNEQSENVTAASTVTFTINSVQEEELPLKLGEVLTIETPASIMKSPEDIKPFIVDNNAKRFPCDQCPRAFKKHARLVEHKRLHTGEKPFTCDECGKEFRIRMRLNEHKLRHSKDKKFKCEMCHLACCTKQDLNLHMRHHTNDRRFQCNLCPKAFVRSSDLKIHVRVHTGEKPYICDICHKCFRANQNLIVHKKSHMGEASKTYKCEHCDKKFMRNIDRKVHMRSHTGEKPYKCEICQRGYSSKFNVRAHIERDHISANGVGTPPRGKKKPGPKPKALREELAKQKKLIEELQQQLLQQMKTDEKILPNEEEVVLDNTLQDCTVKPSSSNDPIQSAYELLNQLKSNSTSASKPLTIIPSPPPTMAMPSPDEYSKTKKTSTTLLPLTITQKIEQHSPASSTPTTASPPPPPPSSTKTTATKVVSQKTSLGIQQVSVTVSMQVENVTPTPTIPEKENAGGLLTTSSSNTTTSVKKERKITSYFTVLGQKTEV